VRREVAADGAEEAGVVGNEGNWFGNGSERDLVVELADANLGCGDGRCGGEEGASEDHAGGIAGTV
jgi:hypothetical protein